MPLAEYHGIKITSLTWSSHTRVRLLPVIYLIRNCLRLTSIKLCPLLPLLTKDGRNLSSNEIDAEDRVSIGRF